MLLPDTTKRHAALSSEGSDNKSCTMCKLSSKALIEGFVIYFSRFPSMGMADQWLKFNFFKQSLFLINTLGYGLRTNI